MQAIIQCFRTIQYDSQPPRTFVLGSFLHTELLHEHVIRLKLLTNDNFLNILRVINYRKTIILEGCL